MKRIIAILLIMVIALSCAGCSDNYDKWDTEQIEEYGFVKIKQIGRYGEGASYIVYDPETNVEYIAITGSYGNFSLCPYYDKTGNISFYGGN